MISTTAAVVNNLVVEITLLLCGLALGVLVCAWLAERFDVPAPFLLILVGIGASYIPGVPTVELTEHVVLFGLLPPLLYAAAQQTSLVDFNANRRPILLLSIGLVVSPRPASGSSPTCCCRV